MLSSIVRPLATILLIFTSSSSNTSAQTMYRCGNMFSQIPCDKVGAIPIITGTPTQSTPVLKGRLLCKAAVPQRLALKDPYSAVVDVGESSRPAVIEYAGQPMMSREYLVTVNAKNSYGAYVGVKPYSCYLSENETNVLLVSETKP